MKSSAASQIGAALRFTLKVKAGPDAGKSYQLLPPKATIGREPGNTVVLTDPKVSRNHATIEFHPDRIALVDLSTRESMQINGRPTKIASLKDGDTIVLGETVFRFRIESAAQAGRPKSLQVAGPRPMAPQGASPPGYPQSFRAGGAAAPRRSQVSDEGAKKLRFYIIVAIVLGGFYYMINSETGEKPAEKGLRTQEEIAADIRSSEERQEVLAKNREFKSEEDRRRYEEAQGHYTQGFRDYQKGNYSRAMRSFETARAIDPAHEMAKRYYTLATRQRDEFVARHILEGKRYREKNMYSRCIASVDKALKSLGDSNEGDLKVKEANALRSECDALMKERF